MSEAAILTSLGLVTVAAIVIVLLDRFAGHLLSEDPDTEDWPA